jgi:biopolymer transport protein ExbD
MARRTAEGCEINMTPMIDVVFQLIIFFIVTIRMDQNYNEDIVLEDAKHGPVIKDQDQSTMIIEVDRHGWISMRGLQLTKQKLNEIVHARYNKHGAFPVLIRGDARARHEDIRAVMDICSRNGIWKINFAAVKSHVTQR